MVAAVTSSLSQLGVMTVFNYPSETGELSQLGLITVNEANEIAKVSQLGAMVVTRGRIDNNKIRVWGFSLDGHDFYVITLGPTETLVYDLTTGQWSEWSSKNIETWRAQTGTNWISMGGDTFDFANSNVVAGDDNFGLLWTVDPTIGYDENPVAESADQPFERQVIGGIPSRLRETVPVGAVYLTGSFATPQIDGASITLYTSDDSGNSWAEHDTIDIEVNNFDQEYVWRSLGRVSAPGKLFKIVDSGATVRIDSLDMR